MTLPRPRRPWDRTDPARRDYFEVLGEGLLAQLAGRPAGGGARGWSPPSGGAWVHVGPSGGIRAFTGKVEVGQGTRVALSLAVAEELRVPLARVDLVMGDTDLCPWDMGTFGSRSMPDAAPALQRVAAGAREALLDLAADKGIGPRDRLEAVDGSVTAPGRSGTVAYGALVTGERRIVAVDPAQPLTAASGWRVAGRPVADPRAEEVVTGRRTYTSDLRLPGMRYGATLHPPRMGSRLIRADLGAAASRPGVQVVHEDGFIGAIAASPREAHSAVAAIRAVWEEAPEPGEAEIETFLRHHPASGDDWDTAERHEGDPVSALAAAPFTVQASYRTAYIAHTPLETRAAVAEWTGTRVTIWVGTQTPFRAREYVATALGIPLEDIRVIVPYTGAGFGGKHGGDVAAAAARLARAAGAPVELTYSREEEFRWGYFRPMAIIDLKAGADRDGHLTAWIFHNVNAGAAALLPPYRIPHQAVDNELSESPLAQGPYRSLAANTNNFARECAIDELAERAGIDPVEFRQRNLDDERLRVVLRRAAETAGWADWHREAGRGRGVAIGLEKGGRVATIATVTARDDRPVRVDRIVTVYEAGTIVHPENLRSQIEGAAVQALGGALFEAIHFDQGRIRNARLSEYRVPRFSDLPEIEAVLLDRPDIPSAGGGETPMIAVAPAIANALYEATGRRRRTLPLLEDDLGLPPTPTAGARPPTRPRAGGSSRGSPARSRGTRRASPR